MGKHALINVEIQRGHDVIVTEVPAHEIDILRAVHGVNNVREGEPTGEHVLLPDSADSEFLRLQGKYRRINAQDPVGIAHRMGARSLEAFGFALGRGDRQTAPQSGFRKHAPEPEVEAESARRKRVAAPAA